jgi:uncharacterized protein with von Willebrand factor type A (vWA) domain
MPVTSDRLFELAACLPSIDIGRREDFRAAARCLLVSRQEDIAMFDRAFDLFWRADALRGRPPEGLRLDEIVRRVPPRERPSQTSPNQPAPRPANAASLGGAANPLGSRDGETEDRPRVDVYSAAEVLRKKDFATLNPDELADARCFLAEMRWTATRRRSRRSRPSRSGRKLDLRRSVRRSLRHGGELLELARRGPKMKRRQLVLLCDISGSMDRYTRLLLHFLYSVEASLQRVEVFVFGTRLTRITRVLRRRDPDAAIAAVASHVQDWAGGTRIGDSLRTFNRRWARRVLGQGAIVLIISDGWDRGDPELLAAEMARLQRSSYRLLWLNPLLGSSSYRPLTQGIQAALPFVDDFLPVHNLASLEALAQTLNEVQQGRPSRRAASSPYDHMASSVE